MASFMESCSKCLGSPSGINMFITASTMNMGGLLQATHTCGIGISPAVQASGVRHCSGLTNILSG